MSINTKEYKIETISKATANTFLASHHYLSKAGYSFRSGSGRGIPVFRLECGQQWRGRGAECPNCGGKCHPGNLWKPCFYRASAWHPWLQRGCCRTDSSVGPGEWLYLSASVGEQPWIPPSNCQLKKLPDRFSARQILPFAGAASIFVENQIIQIRMGVIVFWHISFSSRKLIPDIICNRQ